ncbi:hypothetical protein [Marinovum sp.]|uniref:hypothetical protein n=1 Tax=Marinovum sp. TaxID=2024839 RepID=UPI003A93CBFA
MTTPDWLRPGIYGAVAGAAFVAIVGFSWGGWMTGGGADKYAGDRAQSEVVAALVPICVENARTDIQRGEKLATIRDASTFKRRDALMAAGWATVPGTEAPNRDLAQACLAGLDLNAS